MHGDKSLAIHVFLWISGLMSEWTRFFLTWVHLIDYEMILIIALNSACEVQSFRSQSSFQHKYVLFLQFLQGWEPLDSVYVISSLVSWFLLEHCSPYNSMLSWSHVEIEIRPCVKGSTLWLALRVNRLKSSSE